MPTHHWPELPTAPQESCGMIDAQSTPGSMIAASLPPISSVGRFMVSAAERITCFPVSVEPVR